MDKIIWHTERRKLKDLKPYNKNPRKMTKEQANQLGQSLDKFDYCELVAVQPDNRIIAGHMRVKMLKTRKGQGEEIEVRVPNRMLTDNEMREYLIRSNKNTGEWDWDLLANDFDTHDLLAWGFEANELIGDDDEDTSILDEEDEPVGKCAECGQKLRK